MTEKIKSKEMTPGPEIVDVDWRRMPHRFDTGSRVERFALLMLLADVADYAGYLHDFAVSFYGPEAAAGLADFFALVHREFHKRARAEGVTPEQVDWLMILERLYWRDMADALGEQEAEAARDLAAKLGRELPVDPVEVVKFDPVDAWVEATDDEEG